MNIHDPDKRKNLFNEFGPGKVVIHTNTGDICAWSNPFERHCVSTWEMIDTRKMAAAALQDANRSDITVNKAATDHPPAPNKLPNSPFSK